MTNEIILVPHEEIEGTLQPRVSNSPAQKKETATTDSTEKKLPGSAKEIPVDNWIMPPEQQGYIQGNDRDCL